jgi:serine protease Do
MDNRSTTEQSVMKNDKNMSGRKLGALVVVLLVVFLGAFLYDKYLYKDDKVAQPATLYDGNQTAPAKEATVTSVSDKVSPSVVSIITNTTTRTYFGAVPSQAAGTGIIVSSDGYILTNKHVVNSARSVQVITVDGVTYEDVAVVGTDPLNDVAYLKIKDGKDLPAATLGDSNTVRVGQSVVAIGNALGQYQNTVTSGIISGTGRPIQAGDESGNQVETLTDLLQTDAAINSGNSGGPLLNMAGQVIGINTAVAQDAQGIGFAIPINATKGTLKGVLAGNGVQRAYLGVRYVPITPEITKKYDLSVKQGAYVYGESTSSVISGSPADKGGIKEKDIITKINGAAVGRNGGVSSLVGAYAPGDTIGTTVVRDGSEKELRVTLGTYTD